MIYLDNAATSYPKPAECLRRALEHYLELGASPGRGGYDRAVEADIAVTSVRKRLSRFFGAGDKSHVYFTYNATDALNLLIQGVTKPGDHVVSSRLEHNSVLRPLSHLKAQGKITFDLVPFNADGYIDPKSVEAAIRPETRMVLLTHASNVLGTIQPIKTIGEICRGKGVPLAVDVSQSAGMVPIDMRNGSVQALAFTGHKSLLGPTGIGGLVIDPEADFPIDPMPTRFGGTGVDSKNPFHPLVYPNRLEAGTLNLFGILALGESLAFVESHLEASYRREMALYEKLRAGLKKIEKLRVLGVDGMQDRLPILTCAVDGHAATDVGAILDGDYEIAVRTGLHCAPLVHEDLGTAPEGAIRFSLGPYNTEADIDAALRAMIEISGE
jgi:cysteine desulfurase / selenocysteine lyase